MLHQAKTCAPVTVSVVIPTYKHARFITDTLHSVFNQTHHPLEVIVVNDGSPDDTEDVLKPWHTRGRIVYIRQENKGQAHARNRGIALARGTHIALLDDDDLWPEDKLEWQVAAVKVQPATLLVYGIVTPFHEANASSSGVPVNPYEETPPSGDVLHFFLQRNWIVSPGQTLINRDALRAVGGFDPAIWGCDDYDLYIRLAKLGPFQFQPRPALYYRRHSNNASRNIDRMYVNYCVVQQKHWGHRPSFWQLWPWVQAQWSMRRYFFSRFLREAQYACAAADTQLHRHCLWRAVQIFPPGAIRRTYLRCLLAAARMSAGPITPSKTHPRITRD